MSFFEARSVDTKHVVTFFLALSLVLPKIGVLDLSVVPLLLIAAFAFKPEAIIDTKIIAIISVFILIVASCVISFYLNSTFSLDLLLKPIRNAIIVFLSFVVARRGWIDINGVLLATLIAAATNGAVVAIQFISELLWDVQGILLFYPLIDSFGAMRQQGLSNGFPSSALLCVVGFAIALIYVVEKKSPVYLVLLLMCLPGVLLSARTGTVLGGAVFCFGILYAAWRGNISSVLGFVGGFVLVALLVVASSILDDRVAYMTLVMFEFVYNIIYENRLGVSSTDNLFEMHYFLPAGDWKDWIFGNGRAAWVPGGIESDAWFTQVLVGSGVIGLVLYIVAFLALVGSAIKCSDHVERVAILIVAAVVAVSSVKGPFMFSRFVADPLTLAGGVAIGSLVIRGSLSKRGVVFQQAAEKGQITRSNER